LSKQQHDPAKSANSSAAQLNQLTEQFSWDMVYRS
jgi:hypothetical protein